MNYFLELMVKYFRVKVNMAADKCVTTSLEDGRDDAFVVHLQFQVPGSLE